MVTYDSFCQDIKHILTLSEKFNDTWKLIKHEDGFYLMKSEMKPIKETFEAEDADLEELDSSTVNDESIICENHGRYLCWNYHIVYNQSYSVPMMCFNVHTETGSLVHLEQLWSLLKLGADLVSLNMFETITQMDHPILQMPFFTLHPCKTTEVLKSFCNSKNLTLSWLSTVAPVIDLKVPSEYYAEIT